MDDLNVSLTEMITAFYRTPMRQKRPATAFERDRSLDLHCKKCRRIYCHSSRQWRRKASNSSLFFPSWGLKTILCRHTITGPEALNYDQVAAILTEVLERKITYAKPSYLKCRSIYIKKEVLIKIMSVSQ